MNQNRIFSMKVFSIAMICAGLAFTGCHNDDTTTPPSESDTAAAINETAGTHDTGMAMKPDTVTTNNKMGMAKPNPAKKGMKGKATVMESPKMSGAMEANKEGVYANVEVYPSFPGGSKGLQEYFDKNLNYPAEATDGGVEGTVNVMFTVDETGKLSGAHVMGEKQGYGLDDEALRVVNSMPAWNPGKLKGKNVKTSFTLPVSFQLQ